MFRFEDEKTILYKKLSLKLTIIYLLDGSKDGDRIDRVRSTQNPVEVANLAVKLSIKLSTALFATDVAKRNEV